MCVGFLSILVVEKTFNVCEVMHLFLNIVRWPSLPPLICAANLYFSVMQNNDRLYPDVTDEEDVAVHKQLLESFQYNQVEITKQYQVMLHEKDREIQVFIPSASFLYC